MLPKSVYLAGPWSAKEEIKRRAMELEALGIEVTSRWLDFEMPYGLDVPDVALTEAVHDTEDLERADTVIFNLDLGPSTSGGTFHEHGLARAWHKRIIFVGNLRPNIFFWLGAERYPTWGALIQTMEDLYGDSSAA